MSKRGIYDAVCDVDGCFTEEFRKYVLEQDLLCRRWDRGQGHIIARSWVFRKEQQLDAMDSAYTDIVDKMILLSESWDWDWKFLVQFWKAEEMNSCDDLEQRHFLLTARNQPFLLGGFSRRSEEFIKICSYRMKTVDINCVDGRAGQGGVISRVFRNKRMEFSPYVGYYTYEEYPHRDLALSCHIKCSLALPLSDSSGRSLGVFELVSPLDPSISFIWFFRDPLIREHCQLLQRESLDCCKGLCGQYGMQCNFLYPIAEINNVMERVHKSCYLVLCQTWMLCMLCNSISTCEKFVNDHSASFRNFGTKSFYLEVESTYILQKDEGIVGKAASSPYHLVYCEDVTKFSISEYALAHFARQYDRYACFAMSLLSVYTGDQVYVLEFFLDPSHIEGRDLWAVLVSIIQTMSQNFRTFKLASGKEFGDIGTLSVLIIDANSPNKIVTLGNRGLHLNSSIGENNVEVSRQYFLQQSISETSSKGGIGTPVIGMGKCSKDTQTSTVQSKFQLTVKARYGDDFIKFKLSASPTIHELNQHVSQRLQLEVGTYFFKYQDVDDDWVLITCDDDVGKFWDFAHYFNSGMVQLLANIKWRALNFMGCSHRQNHCLV